MRTDDNKNPTAFTTDLAKQAGLKPYIDYEPGTTFPGPAPVGKTTLVTAKLLGDPIELTLKVLDNCGFYTKLGALRWAYIAIPSELWSELTKKQKIDVISFMYRREGGTEMWDLFK